MESRDPTTVCPTVQGNLKYKPRVHCCIAMTKNICGHLSVLPLEPSAQGSHGPVRAGPEEATKIDQRAGSKMITSAVRKGWESWG